MRTGLWSLLAIALLGVPSALVSQVATVDPDPTEAEQVDPGDILSAARGAQARLSGSA